MPIHTIAVSVSLTSLSPNERSNWIIRPTSMLCPMTIWRATVRRPGIGVGQVAVDDAHQDGLLVVHAHVLQEAGVDVVVLRSRASLSPTIQPIIPARIAAVTTSVTMFIGCCHHGSTTGSVVVGRRRRGAVVVARAAASASIRSSSHHLIERQVGVGVHAASLPANGGRPASLGSGLAMGRPLRSHHGEQRPRRPTTCGELGRDATVRSCGRLASGSPETATGRPPTS